MTVDIENKVIELKMKRKENRNKTWMIMESPRKLHSICQINFTMKRIKSQEKILLDIYFCLHFIGREY